MAVIHVLDKHTAELIAAGEVVERPASVVKELLENAIDAESTSITVRIERGGIKLIEIQDNGAGIEPDEIPKAFIRHATSKIATADDLNSILTLGFRGEALASIASVSRTTLTTKAQNAEFAMQYVVEGGEEVSFETAARPNGTTITVEDLFYNTPARMKFLKKDQSETNYIQDVVLRLAMSHPEISFQLIKDGKEQFRTPGNGDLLTTIHALQGASFAKGLLPVYAEQDGNTLSGFVTMPKASRGSRAMQFFFINGRYIKNRTMMAALEQACKGSVMAGKFPGCVLNLTISPEKVDVNVHPAKTEVRFANEGEVFNIVYQGVKTALATPEASEREIILYTDNRDVKQNDFALNKNDENLQLSGRSILRPNPFETNETKAINQELLYSRSDVAYIKNTGIDVEADTDTVFYDADVVQSKSENTSADVNKLSFASETDINANLPVQTDNNDLHIRVIGEVFKTYIVAQINDDICFIDKHAAHERILYEKLIKNLGKTAGQTLLSPVDVQLSAEEKNVLLSESDFLSDNGIDIEDFGGNTVLVRAVPPTVLEGEIPAFISEIAQKLAKGIKSALSEKQEWLYASISCRGAIKARDYTTEPEMLALVQEVMLEDTPKFCPHGRPIVLTLTQKELEKYFGRLG